MMDDADGYAIAQLSDALHEAEREIVRLREALTAAKSVLRKLIECEALVVDDGVAWVGDESFYLTETEMAVAAAVAAASDGQTEDEMEQP